MAIKKLQKNIKNKKDPKNILIKVKDKTTFTEELSYYLENAVDDYLDINLS